jgi:Uma2 family endonuclease
MASSSSSRSERKNDVALLYAKRSARRRRRPAMTTAEYLATPETVRPQELAFGVWRVAESPTPRHQQAVLSLVLSVHEYLQVNRVGTVWLAPLDVILDDEQALVVQPDLFVISNERAHILTDRVRGAPDLVVEVLSPHPRVGDSNERVQWFAQYGVRECWLVHQIDRWIDVLTFEDGRTTMRRRFAAHERIESNVLPKFNRSLTGILGYG